MRPRVAADAAHTLSRLVVVIGVLLVVDLVVIRLVGPSAPDQAWRAGAYSPTAMLLPGALIGLGPLIARVGAKLPDLLGLVPTLGAAILIPALNVVSGDDTAGAMFVTLLPVLYAAYHLRRGSALATAVVAAVGSVASNLALKPLDIACRNSIYIGVVSLTVAVVVANLRNSAHSHTAALEDQVRIDELTGLSTRRVLTTAATEVLSRTSAALLVVDVDRFKAINDDFGHPVGDRALIEIATLVQSAFRPSDVVARLGGDEFAVLLAACPEEIAVERADRLVGLVKQADLQVDGRRVPLSISVGVAHSTQAGADSFEALYEAADADLYQAKEVGRVEQRHPGITTAA